MKMTIKHDCIALTSEHELTNDQQRNVKYTKTQRGQKSCRHY